MKIFSITAHISYLLLAVSLLQGCTSHRYLQLNPPTAVIEHDIHPMADLADLNHNETTKLFDLCIQSDEKTTANDVYFLSCSNELLSRDDLPVRQRDEVIALYNQSLANLVKFSLQESHSPHLLVVIKSQQPILENNKLTLVSNFQILDPRLNFKVFGELGVVAVAERKNTQKGTDKYYPLEGIFSSVNFLFESVNYRPGQTIVTLSYDLVNDESPVYLGSNAYIQKYSPAAAFLALIEKADINDFNLLGLIQAGKAEYRRGIFAVDPISTNKIPLIMTHGLNSDPLIWRYLTIAMLNDSDINERYQIWHFYYPSGPPPFFTAMKLRKQIKGLVNSINNEKLTEQAVFIGHSMGGIITHLLTSKSDYILWDSTFVERPEKLLEQPNPDLENIFIFDPVFKHNTVFFLDTPHRGSKIASSFVGYISAGLVTLPYSFNSLFQAFVNKIGLEKLTIGMRAIGSSPNSIEVLRPGHPIMNALITLPVAGKVYSVVGSDGRLQCENELQCTKISDSVVNYASAHYAEAEQEVIMHSTHNSFENEQTIKFIMAKLQSTATK